MHFAPSVNDTAATRRAHVRQLGHRKQLQTWSCYLFCVTPGCLGWGLALKQFVLATNQKLAHLQTSTQ
eukprot:929289-Lingulodinium_polyedra.AAC.1